MQAFLMPGAKDDYRRCMASRGIRTSDLTDLYLQVENHYPPVSYDTPSNPILLPGWAAAWAFETQAANTDASCRDHLVDVAMATVPPTLRDFEQDNAAALQATAAGWRGMPAAVSSLRATVRITD
jgi:hypothetical protein